MGAVEKVRKHEVEEEAVDLLTLLIEQVVDYAIFVVDRTATSPPGTPGPSESRDTPRNEIIGRPYSVFFTEEDRAAGKPDTILSHAASARPISGGGLARAQGRQPLLGFGRRHRASRSIAVRSGASPRSPVT